MANLEALGWHLWWEEGEKARASLTAQSCSRGVDHMRMSRGAQEQILCVKWKIRSHKGGESHAQWRWLECAVLAVDREETGREGRREPWT